MIRTWTLAALAACILLPAVAAAQATPRPSRPRARTRVERGPFGVFTFNDSRGRIGVIVKTDADAADDKLGARIEGVTPGGPAEKAGLKASDIITRFNSTALGGTQAEGNEESGPGMKLIELARALEPGDTVQVEYRRGNDTRKATIIAEDLGWAMMQRGEMPEMGPMEGMLPKMHMGPGGGGPGEFEFAFGSPWGGIEMVKLNPDLGDYFGTREGVLVVRAPEDSTLALKGGDVIISIGGRKPTSPEQAMRILRSYDTGETVTLDVLRKQKHVTVTWKVPAMEDRFYHNRMGTPEHPTRFRVEAPMRLRSLKVPVWKIRNLIRVI
ncbi:MAG TPA: PDZ domain-containing protein [Gemmatimonadales bacterium]|nr:PDZ domain-containing protein [Gemmatimonadales bacterium]